MILDALPALTCVVRAAIHCAAVIPCLNEALAIARIIIGVRQFLETVIVVDDGSTDSTAILAEGAGARVIVHPQRQGKGAALRSGWAEARRMGFDWALCLDGDGQHSPADIPLFLERAQGGDVDLVCGNRMSDTTGMPFVRRWTNRFMSWQLSRVAGIPLPDTQCGYRLLNLEAASAVPICSDCFEIESELLVAFASAGRRIAFVPIQVIYGDERSKISPLRDTWRWFRWLRQTRRNAWPSRRSH